MTMKTTQKEKVRNYFSNLAIGKSRDRHTIGRDLDIAPDQVSSITSELIEEGFLDGFKQLAGLKEGSYSRARPQSNGRRVNGQVSELQFAVSSIVEEYLRASKKFGAMASAHEGYAVILEELDELWDEIKNQIQDKEAIRSEAIQVGAMALRFLVDVCELEPPHV